MKVYKNVSILNDIVFELEAIGVKIDDEDEILRLIWYISPLY